MVALGSTIASPFFTCTLRVGREASATPLEKGNKKSTAPSPRPCARSDCICCRQLRRQLQVTERLQPLASTRLWLLCHQRIPPCGLCQPSLRCGKVDKS